MTYSTHMIDEKNIGTSLASHRVRNSRRRRHIAAVSSYVGGSHIAGFGI
ncbi:hypothetical protein [Robiginitomaculum antarcticum]|nr:hypothetical protein [Robiginitomaculum antarcticum]